VFEVGEDPENVLRWEILGRGMASLLFSMTLMKILTGRTNSPECHMISKVNPEEA
jgi:hypothetical protein